ncbi:MAG: AAA family ATPase [Phycisphaerales bacterium]|nr:AAA family ATPase [Phycisphaerales bacterium]
MLTKLTVRNFKRFGEAEIELGNPVVFVGPNNSGKTTALQALALWHIGLKRWNEKRRGKKTPGQRPGVTINRRDLIALPVPDSNLLWRDLHVRDIRRSNGSQETSNIRVDLIVDGVTAKSPWTCGLEFDYANEESFYCRPLRRPDAEGARFPVPDEASNINVAYLPPMSGLAANETRLDPGAVNVRVGEGRTAEVLRNLCYRLVEQQADRTAWDIIHDRVQHLFGVDLDEPRYIAERGEIVMTYRERSGVRLDLSSAGRGLQQVLLLLSYIHANPNTALLLDEPDAHLEILRQRQIYNLLSDVAAQQQCQVIIASHSEIFLNEAADRDVVVAFVGTPHRIDDRGSQLLKSLKEIGCEQYYQAEQMGWVLYVEGATDLAILSAFARNLGHDAAGVLERPFACFVQNNSTAAQSHFHGLREAKNDLVGFAIFDRLDRELPADPHLRMYQWKRREIGNYLCRPDVLYEYAAKSVVESVPGPLFEEGELNKRREAMVKCVADFVPRVALRDSNDQWWHDTKASDEFLDRVFADFYKALGLPNMLRKTDYHVLARLMRPDWIDSEVKHVLDLIVETAGSAKPRDEGL